MPYETGVVDEWTGENAARRRTAAACARRCCSPPRRPPTRPTTRSCAARAPAGKVLRLKRSVPDAHEPVLPEGHRAGRSNIGLPRDLPDRREAAARRSTTSSTRRRRCPPSGTLRLARQPVHAPVRRRRRRHRGLRADLRGRGRHGARAAHADDRPRPGRDAQPRLWRRRDDARRAASASAPRQPSGGAIGPPPSVDGVSAVFAAAAKLAKPRRLSTHARAQVLGLHAQRDAAGQRGDGAGGAARLRAALRVVARSAESDLVRAGAQRSRDGAARAR